MYVYDLLPVLVFWWKEQVSLPPFLGCVPECIIKGIVTYVLLQFHMVWMGPQSSKEHTGTTTELILGLFDGTVA